MRKRGLCCRPVSVCPSVTLVYCIQTAEDIVKLLYRPGSPIILVFFDPERRYSIPREPLQRWCKIYRGGKILQFFDWNRHLSRKRYEIGPWLLWDVDRKSYALYRMVTSSLTLTDTNPVFKVKAFLKSNISKTVHLRDKVIGTLEHNKKRQPVYWMVPLSMTLTDPWPGFQGRDIFRHWISQKRHEIES